jgi:GWxTD domain-containing protein
LTIIWLSSCSIENTPQNTPAQNLLNFANMYNPRATTIFPKYTLYNENDSVSTLYIYLYLPQLAFRNIGGTLQAKIYLNVKATPSYLDRRIIDTISKTFVIKQISKQKSLVIPIHLRPILDSTYLLNIYIKDLYRRRSNIAFIEVDKTSPNRDANFLVRYADDFKPVFGHAVYPDYEYLISHNSGADTLYAFHYKPDTTLPNPPFFLGKRTRRLFADTIIAFASNKPIKFTMPGIYLISTSDQDPHGKMLAYFYDDFPVIAKASEMIPPLGYITTTNEYKRLLNAYSPKMAVDSFWLSIAEQPQQAKELIKVYYNRVFLANVYFSTHKPGWQTDRGMIYIIFGPPKYVYKSQNSEKWIYSLSGNAPLQFVFRKYKNPYCENEYVLNRLLDYKPVWYQAVQTWRRGKI